MADSSSLLHSMSMGFLVEEKAAIVWRGLMVWEEGEEHTPLLHSIPFPLSGNVSHSEVSTSGGLGCPGRAASRPAPWDWGYSAHPLTTGTTLRWVWLSGRGCGALIIPTVLWD